MAGTRTRVRASLQIIWQGPIIATRSPSHRYWIVKDCIVYQKMMGPPRFELGTYTFLKCL